MRVAALLNTQLLFPRWRTLRVTDFLLRGVPAFRRAAALDRMADLLLDVVLRLEESEPASPVRDVVDVVGELVHELVHLVQAYFGGE